MSTIYGHKLRWVEDQADCTECGSSHGKWCMVSVALETPHRVEHPSDPAESPRKLLCRECLPVWKADAKVHWERHVELTEYFSTHRAMQ